jgi:hypothetical protein
MVIISCKARRAQAAVAAAAVSFHLSSFTPISSLTIIATELKRPKIAVQTNMPRPKGG